MTLGKLLGDHPKWMNAALREADRALEEGEVPIGAVVVHRDQIVGRGHNMVERLRDPTAHAAVIAPFDYTALLWGTLFGWLVWQELPGTNVWLGAAIVVASGLYIVHRETRMRTSPGAAD